MSYRDDMEELRGECYRRSHRSCQWVGEPPAVPARPDPASAILDSAVIGRWRDTIACAAMAAVYGQVERRRKLAAQAIEDAQACRVPRLADLIDRVVVLLNAAELQAAEDVLAGWLGTRPAPLQRP